MTLKVLGPLRVDITTISLSEPHRCLFRKTLHLPSRLASGQGAKSRIIIQVLLGMNLVRQTSNFVPKLTTDQRT